MKRFLLLAALLVAPLAASGAAVSKFPAISLNGQTNIVSDNGTALTFNGTPIGGAGVFTNISGVIKPSGGQTTNVFLFKSGLADNATNVALVVDTANTWTELGSAIASYRNNGTNLLSLLANGNLGLGRSAFTYGDPEDYAVNIVKDASQGEGDYTQVYIAATTDPSDPNGTSGDINLNVANNADFQVKGRAYGVNSSTNYASGEFGAGVQNGPQAYVALVAQGADGQMNYREEIGVDLFGGHSWNSVRYANGAVGGSFSWQSNNSTDDLMVLGVDSLFYRSRAADNATNVALVVDTVNEWTGGNLLSLKNSTTDKFTVAYDGAVTSDSLTASRVVYGNGSKALTSVATTALIKGDGTAAGASDVTTTLGYTPLNKAGDTMTGNLLFTDNTYDIGASGATRPRNLYLAGTALVAGQIQGSANVQAGASANFYWLGRANLNSPSDGVIRLANNAETDFGRLQFGGTTTSFPALKRSGTELQVRLADDSAYGPLASSTHTIDGDVILTRDAANTLALRNGANAQALRVYNTYTDASNNEFGNIGWSGNVFYLGTSKNGTGSNRDVVIASQSGVIGFERNGVARRWNVDANGHFVAGADNTYDIGASGATRPRNIYVAATLQGGSVYAANANNLGFITFGYIAAPSDGVWTLKNNAGTDWGRLQFGGTSASFPALKRSSAGITTQLADDSGPTYLLGTQLVTTKTADYTVTTADSKTVFTNEGTTAKRNNTLPGAAAGLTYTFIVQDTDGVTVTAAAGDTIRIAGSVSGAAGNIDSTTVGSSVTLVAINATEWVATSSLGTWTVSP